ncbi:MAG: EAL domain-containing protein [Burkholderiaceae bacterium]|nr:EAL domain-containing protein [Burkholderiaceae bacterium]
MTRALLIGAGAFLACMLAQLIAVNDPQAVIVWPASGLAFAAARRWHWSAALPAGIGAAVWTAMHFQSPALVAGAALASTTGPICAAALLTRIEAWKPAEYRLESSIRLLLCVALISAPVDALIASLAGSLSSAELPIHAISAFLYWWLIDSLGTLVVAPMVLAWLPARESATDGSHRSETAIDPGGVMLTGIVILASLIVAGFGQGPYGYALAFFYIPIVAWTAVRCQERATATTLLATAAALLLARAYAVADGNDDPFRNVEASILVFAAVLVAQLLQATATDRRNALIRVARQARQDMSTGLLNDRGLLSDVGERLAVPSRPDYGLIGLHLHNFDTLNDLCGAIQALQLEQGVAALLSRQPGACAAARLSAGRFALLVRAESVSQVRTIAREIYAQLNGQVYRTEHGSVRLQACVGGLLVDRHALINSEDCLLSLSDAMAIAASVRDPQLFVEPLSQTMIDARRAHQGKIESIRESIRDQRFAIHAQPIVDPDAPENMLSYEILVRLLDRDGGLIRPPEFLSLAVQAQMTPAMDRGVIRKVFAWLAANPQALDRTWKCSINLSGLTMSEGTIAGFIREQRSFFGIPAEKVVFEITESEAIRSPGAASRLVDELKSEGFGIALDDFGTGLATFEYLKRFPIDYLKIDGSFIRNLVTNPIDEEIVLSTVRVARRLNVRTIAEHVHNQEIFDRLGELGVLHIQGELIGAPIPIESLFAAQNTRSVGVGAPVARAGQAPEAAATSGLSGQDGGTRRESSTSPK